MACFAEDATAFAPFAGFAERLSGATAIGEMFATVIANVRARGGSELPLAFSDTTVQVVGDTAIVTFHLRGGRLGRRTLVLRRGERGWRIIHLHASTIVPVG